MTSSSGPDRQAWLERLEEAAALPPGHLRREALQQEVQQRGGWAAAHWQTLVSEQAALRAALEDAEPPAGLQSRLRAIPGQHRRSQPLGRRSLLWGGAAAVMLLAVGAHVRISPADDPERVVREVALLALNDHLDTHEQDVLTTDARALQRDLQSHIPFPLDLPDIGPAMQAVGGRRCTLGSHVVAFTAWRGPGGRLTLLQLRRGDFGLPADMPARIVPMDGPAARGRPLDVFFFGRGDVVWVVVADDPGDLRSVRQAVSRS